MLIRKDDLDKNVKDAIIDIAKKYGTPFYIYSFDKIESKIALLKMRYVDAAIYTIRLKQTLILIY